MSPTARPSSAQGLRKSRTSARSNTGRSLRNEDSGSPVPPGSPFQDSPTSTPSLSNSADQKTANEAFFSNLGQANAARPDDLPPSQGGRYQGFGNTPAPTSSSHPSFDMTSKAAPSLSEFQENPVAALSKGWSLFSAAVAGASRAVSENVIQPGVERVMDPEFQAGVRGYVSEAGKRVGEAGRSANAWGKNTLGVDVAEQVGGVIGTVKDKVGGGPQSRGYGTVGQEYDHEAETSALYNDEEDEVGEFSGWSSQRDISGISSSSVSGGASVAKTSASAKKADDWDEWKDF